MLLWTLGCIYLFKLVPFFFFFKEIYPGVELLGHMVVLFLVFEKHPYYFPQWLHQFTFPPTVYEGSLFFISLPTFVICILFDDSHAEGDFKIGISSGHCSAWSPLSASHQSDLQPRHVLVHAPLPTCSSHCGCWNRCIPSITGPLPGSPPLERLGFHGSM